MTTNKKITALKAELFDIISQQDFIGNQLNQLEGMKRQKLDELQAEIMKLQEKTSKKAGE